MLITGQFRTIKNELCTVKILSDGDDSTTKTIGEDGLFFAEDPVTIETDCDNTLEHLIRKSCSINLVCDDYIGDSLWASNARNIIVNIKKGNQTVFAGYVEPNSFNQPFAKPLEEFTINCIDAISTLQYYKYKNATLRNYDDIKKNASSATFKEMLQQMFADIINNLNIDGNSEPKLIYDCSKAVTQGYQKTTFATMAMDESFLLGEEFDDCWTNEEILDEMLRYLNLHIVQDGFNFFIYDWNTIKNGRNVWYDVLNDSNFTLRTPSTVTLTSAMHGADDTNISVDDVYNQFQVKCELENEDVVIESPLEDKDLSSLFNGRQLYCREMWSDADSDKDGDIDSSDLNGLKKLLLNQYISKDESEHIKCVDWYIQAVYNKKWQMHLNNGEGDITDIYSLSGNRYINQWNVAKYLRDNKLTPSLFKFGKDERKTNAMDNEPTGKVSMSNYLYISVNGSYSISDDEETNPTPTPLELQAHAPMIEYIGGASGATYSPPDDETTNYLVFTGKLTLQPQQNDTGVYSEIYADAQNLSDASFFWKYINNNVDFWFNEEADGSTHSGYKGRFYTRKFFTMTNPTDEINENSYLVNAVSLQPPAECKTKQLSYKFSEHNFDENADLVSKLPVLECELIIGNKRLIETDVDQWGNSTFQWVTIGEEPTFVYEDDGETYTITTFTLGINPKLDDYIIGNEYDLQNTISVNMNLDMEGTAIPIKRSDNLSGAVQFRILGPINTTWNQITRRHPTWFRSTKWYDHNKNVLAHCGNIILKDFGAKIASDNAGNNFVGEYNDLIYMSDETDKFINKNESTTFKFITQLTSAEAIAKGVKNGININAVKNTIAEAPVSTIYNYTTLETAKPEEHYVNQYYLEYCQPRIKMEATMHDDIINWRNRYTSNVLNRTFFIQSTNVNLKYNNAEVTFKEI